METKGGVFRKLGLRDQGWGWKEIRVKDNGLGW